MSNMSDEEKHENRAETMREAEDLVRDLVRALEYDEECCARLLLLLDLFENKTDGQIAGIVAGACRAVAFGMSGLAEEYSHEYIRTLKISRMMNK
jgi:hypothetical protein